MKKRIILHVGLPKTASTALQKWSYENRLYLHKNDIDYPDAVVSEMDPKHQFLVEALKSEKFCKLNDILQQSHCGTVFLSTEALSNQFQDFTYNQLAEFRKVISGHELIIFIVARSWQGWIRSYYNQCLINPPYPGYPYATKLSLEDFSKLDRNRFLWNLPNQKYKLSSAYGATKTVVASFDQDWISDWSRLLAFDGSGVILPRLNVSLEPELISLVLNLNRAEVSAGTRDIVMSAIQRATHAKILILNEYKNMPVTDGEKKGSIQFLKKLAEQKIIAESIVENLVSSIENTHV